MMDRLKQCWASVQAAAQASGRLASYKWVVRSRFDSVFFAPIPPLLTGLQTDTVYARARRVGPGYKDVDNEMISYWMWWDVCADGHGWGSQEPGNHPELNNWRCVWKDGSGPPPPLRPQTTPAAKLGVNDGKCMVSRAGSGGPTGAATASLPDLRPFRH